MPKNLLPVAREGFRYICCIVILFVIFRILELDFLSFLMILALGSTIYFFRNPEREVSNYAEGSVVSVVDGKVSNITELENDKNFAYKIDIKTNYKDVSLLRVPFSSTVEDISIFNGTRVSNSSNLFHKLNEYGVIIFEDNNHNKIKVEHRLTRSLDNLHVNVIKSQNLLQAQRYGFMLSGVTSIYLPSNFRLNISVGTEVVASKTLIGYFS